MKRLEILIGLLGVMIAARSALADPTPLSSPMNIFGKDDRVPMLDWKHPWSAIGKLGSAGNWYCTGVIVGRDLVLTNAHCLFMQDGSIKNPPALWFMPNYKHGQSKVKVNVLTYWAGTDVPEKNWANDWAVLKVDQNIGDRFGIIEPMVIDYTHLENVRNSVTLAGYSHDFMKGETAGAHENCSLRELSPEGTLYHDCDMTGGASGSPIFTWSKKAHEYVIVALNSYHKTRNGGEVVGEEWTEDTTNAAVPASSFIEAIRAAREQSAAEVAAKKKTAGKR